MNARRVVRSLRAAFVFLTRLPVGGGRPFDAIELRWSSAFFPVVGLALGAGLAVVHAVANWAIGAWGAAVVTVGVSLVTTGAFHEDGLADTCDAVGGGYTRERILEILKDSRVGTFGASALALSLVARVGALASMKTGAASALIVIESLSRAPPVVVLAFVPYATRPAVAKSRDVAQGAAAQAVVAVSTAALVLGGACVFGAVSVSSAVGIALLAASVCALSTRYLARKVGGMTGDFLGAIQQLVALALWLAWAAPG